MPYSRLAADLARGRLPAFSFITPNLIDDMHDGTVADGDKWVATIVVSPSTPRGTRSARLFNHYSLLATAEQLLHLPRLGLASAFPTMTAAFRL